VKSESAQSILRSPIVWVGGKGRNFRWILSHFPEHRVYTEAFGGGAAVLLNKPAAEVEIYNDLDDRLVAIFSVLRSAAKCKALQQQLMFTPHHETEYRHAWEVPLSRCQIERARVAFVQLRMTFGGFGSRGKRSGFAFAKSSSASRKSAAVVDDLMAYSQRLRHVTVMSRDACDVIGRFDCKEALHYVDPPYAPATRQMRGAGEYKHELDDAGHHRLAKTLRRCKGKVVLSGYPSALYAELYKGWRTSDREQALSARANAKTRRALSACG
jgi:DNA adenine methylase